jgi:hypothetical protein
MASLKMERRIKSLLPMGITDQPSVVLLLLVLVVR